MAELSRDKDPIAPSDVKQPGGGHRRKPISHEMLRKLEAAGKVELRRQQKRAEEPHAAAPSSSSSESLTLEELRDRIDKLEIKDCQEAQALLQAALDLAKNVAASGHFTIAWCFNDLGVALDDADCRADAETCYKHALEIGNALDPNTDTQLAIATFLNNYAILQQTASRLTAAENSFQEALSLRRKHASDKKSRLAQGYCNLALFLAETNSRELERAKALLDEVREHPEAPHHGSARPAWTLGNLLWRLALKAGDLHKAEELLEQSRDLHREAIESFEATGEEARLVQAVQDQLDLLENSQNG